MIWNFSQDTFAVQFHFIVLAQIHVISDVINHIGKWGKLILQNGLLFRQNLHLNFILTTDGKRDRMISSHINCEKQINRLVNDFYSSV